MASPVDQQEEIIIKEPSPQDVLLGQGYYRHPGNQKLNEIVDSKVHEYQNQSRPFKTYMAHEIIVRLRKTGVRFLKELAPNGWVIVEDDREAREKVAQRFQYMMRLQAKKEKEVGTKPPTTKAIDPKIEAAAAATTATFATTATYVRAPQPHLIWQGTSVKVPFLPVFHQLQKSSVLVDEDVNIVSKRLIQCFHIIEVEALFNSEEANAVLKGPENHKMQMNLWKPLGGTGGVIVELVRLVGDAMTFQKYSRYVLEAATGLFDRYKESIVQSRMITTSTVQDQVALYAANLTVGPNKLPTKSPATLANVEEKPPNKTAQIQSRRPQSGVFVSGGVQKEAQIKIYTTSALSDYDRDAQSQAKRPSLKGFVPLLPRVGDHDDNVENKIKPVPSTKHISVADTCVTASSRWVAGVEEHGARPPEEQPVSFASAFSRWESGAIGTHKRIAAAPIPAAVGKLNVPKQSSVVGSNDPRGSLEQTMDPMIMSHPGKVAERKEGPPSPLDNGALDSQPLTPCSVVHKESIRQLSPTSEYFTASNAQDMESDKDDDDSSERSNPVSRWSTGMPTLDAKYNANNIAGNLPVDTKATDQAAKSLKRMSISSNDASFIGPTMHRDVFEAFPVGTNDEMKCDNSWDGDPVVDHGSISSKQSFIPPSFFGSIAPGTHSKTRRLTTAPSPANSLSSHISIEMRSLPSPATSFHSADIFSLPSPAGSFKSQCSTGARSLKIDYMDLSVSPSMFHSDRSSDVEKANDITAVVPPAIFVHFGSASLEAPPE